MSTNTAAEAPAPARPQTVDYAIYALIARCVFALGSALALFGSRSSLSRALADSNRKDVAQHKDHLWTASELHDHVNAALRGNLVSTVVTIVLVAIIALYLRRGRNWARFVYLIFAVLFRDLYLVLGFFQHDTTLLVRLLTGLAGVSALAALALLFLPPSNAFFRPAATARRGLFGSMFGVPAARAKAAPAGTASPDDAGSQAHAETQAHAEAASGSDDEPVAEPVEAPVADQPTERRPPRGKSRQSGAGGTAR